MVYHRHCCSTKSLHFLNRFLLKLVYSSKALPRMSFFFFFVFCYCPMHVVHVLPLLSFSFSPSFSPLSMRVHVCFGRQSLFELIKYDSNLTGKFVNFCFYSNESTYASFSTSFLPSIHRLILKLISPMFNSFNGSI